MRRLCYILPFNQTQSHILNSKYFKFNIMYTSRMYATITCYI